MPGKSTGKAPSLRIVDLTHPAAFCHRPRFADQHRARKLIIPDLRAHLELDAASGPDGFVFVGVRGGQLRRSNFSRPWARAPAQAGLSAGMHVRDLRHTGITFTAETGASLAELMSRTGHSSTRAARVYLHVRQEQDQEIAATLDRMAKRELKRPKDAAVIDFLPGHPGTHRARTGHAEPT